MGSEKQKEKRGRKGKKESTRIADPVSATAQIDDIPRPVYCGDASRE